VKVLVTGGGGFLGGWICRQLAERGDTPVAYQRSAAPDLSAKGIEVRRGDLLDVRALADAAEGCEAIIHCAARAGAWGDRAVYRAINVTGTQNVIDACRNAGIRRLVHASSPSIVHGGGDIEGGDESLPVATAFKAAYPETKAEAERRVLAANHASLRTVALRPHLVWGPGDNQLLPRLVERADAGPLRLPGPDKLIDATYVENAALAHLLALDALDANPACAGRAYFVSNGEPWTQSRIIAGLLRCTGREAIIRSVPPAVAYAAGAACEALWTLGRREDEPPVTRWSAEQLSTAHWFDISAARRDLGYEPAVSMDEGLRRLSAWWKVEKSAIRDS